MTRKSNRSHPYLPIPCISKKEEMHDIWNGRGQKKRENEKARKKWRTNRKKRKRTNVVCFQSEVRQVTAVPLQGFLQVTFPLDSFCCYSWFNKTFGKLRCQSICSQKWSDFPKRSTSNFLQGLDVGRIGDKEEIPVSRTVSGWSLFNDTGADWAQTKKANLWAVWSKSAIIYNPYGREKKITGENNGAHMIVIT